MASLGTRWGSLGTPSPVGGASAAGTWTPTPWATATPCLATACVACSTRQGLAASAVRKASTGARWPRGPRTSVRVSSPPGPSLVLVQNGTGFALLHALPQPRDLIFLLPRSLALSSLSTGSAGDCPQGPGACHLSHSPRPWAAVRLCLLDALFPSLPAAWLTRGPVPPAPAQRAKVHTTRGRLQSTAGSC